MPDAPDQSAVVVLEPVAWRWQEYDHPEDPWIFSETGPREHEEHANLQPLYAAAPKPTLSGEAAIYVPMNLDSLGRGPADKGDTDRIEHQVWDPETCETLCVAKDEETARWIVAALSSPLPGEE